MGEAFRPGQSLQNIRSERLLSPGIERDFHRMGLPIGRSNIDRFDTYQ